MRQYYRCSIIFFSLFWKSHCFPCHPVTIQLVWMSIVLPLVSHAIQFTHWFDHKHLTHRIVCGLTCDFLMNKTLEEWVNETHGEQLVFQKKTDNAGSPTTRTLFCCYVNSCKRLFLVHVFSITNLDFLFISYGDLVPQTVQGKIVGALCSFSGIFLIALMAPLLQKG